MVSIGLANAEMGISLCETNGICFSHGFSVPRRSTFVVTVGTNRVKQNWVYGLRTHYHGAIGVRLKAALANRSVDSELLEKEFEFKPSFEEYLKAMESVRTGREKKQTRGSKSLKSKNADSGKLRDIESNTQKELEGNLGGEIDNKEIERSRVKDVRKISFVEKDNELEDKERKKNNLNVNRKWEKNLTYSVKKRQKDAELEGQKRKTDKDSHKGSNMDPEMEGNFNHFETVPLQKVAVENMERKRNKRIADRIIDDEEEAVEMERAAFRTVEDFNDIWGKPRLSRNEMEERIQKLARSLNGADIDIPEWMFSKMMRSAKIRFTDHSMLRIIQILGKLGNWRRVLQLIEWLQVRERFKSHKTRYVYTAALDTLGKARRPVEALNLFYAMQQNLSTYPDLVAYHCIAVTLGQAGHMRELFEVIDSMRSSPKKKFKTGILEKWDPRLEPDIVVYNAVLNACVRRKQWEGAFWVLQQLKEQGQQPTSTTYGLVMEVMLECGKYNLVHDFFKKILKSSIPNALTYRVLVNTLWKEGKTDEAVLAVEDMEKRGVVGSAAVYYDLARCLCSAGRCQDALVQIDKVCRVAKKPLVVTYTGLIQACLDAGNIQNGVCIFNHMQKFCSPNLVTCNIMLKAYLEYGMFEEARNLFQKMLEDVTHIGKRADCEGLVMPDMYTFNTMLEACFVEQQWDEFEFVYTQMLHHGYRFNAKRHLRMIMDAYRAGKGEILETTWKHLVQSGQTPPPLLLKEMFCMKLEQGDHAAALSSITSHTFSEFPVFSQHTWLNCLKENARRFEHDSLMRLVREGTLFVSKDESQDLMLRNLVSSCREFFRTHMEVPEMYTSTKISVN
ncbi:hypothetical protein NMG60_11005182 [Bertholletia excelsa]